MPNPPDPNVPNPPDPNLPNPPDPNVPDPPDPNLPNPPDSNPDGSSAVPVGWVVGPSLLGVGLLAAVGAAMLSHRQRGPRWVHGHVSARLRPHSATTAVDGPPGHAVRLQPRADPGEQTVQEEEP
ncbi:hypothetical protein [Streptomyces sp. WAC06614]|uniref:hypothetical protein n=1 Tax=Streptomyces sp. WAC06614 TaxID=2487416 RepID=UPI000F7B9D7B|nr:hypothetical protein [Streptomyces sp. WAC06614]RSS80687.1 hypothetical protein EF918_12910 [Streptomyces sp. WAC06614]